MASKQQYKQFNCYQILGVPPTATLQEIKRSYKQISLQHHPDRGGSHENQVKVNLAYEVLSDPIQRQAHDTYWQIPAVSDFSTPAASETNKSRQTYTPPQETSSKPHSNQQKNHRRDPLSALKNRIYHDIEKERSKIWEDLNNRSRKNENDFKQKLSNKRKETAVIFTCTFILSALAIEYPGLWIGVVLLGSWVISRLNGIQIANHRFSMLKILPNELKQHAHQEAKESCNKEATKLERHFSSLASLSELLLRSSTFDDSEEQIARRLTASFFLMGYTPLQFDRQNRTLLFTDEEEKLLVRFRHRTGNATNIAYVEKLASLMLGNGANRGFLFCSPGLSVNAENYANAKKIKWYTLETMNQWINEVLVSDYNGPAGNALRNLDTLINFLATISHSLVSKNYSRYTY